MIKSLLIVLLGTALLGATVLQAASATSCANEPSPCGANSTCVNTTNSYRCNCPRGYYYNRAARTCVDVDECALTNPPCVSPDDYDTANSTRCVNTPGSFRCECPAGYQVTIQWIRRPYYWTYACTDVDECKATPSICGDPSATCVNREGSYVCRCPDTTYYDYKTKRCADVDECAVTNPPCGGGSFCVNTPGGYTCACEPGSGLGYVPSINDCVADLCASKPCGGNSTCGMATPSSYFCGCAPGFAYNTTLRTCTTFVGLASLTIEAGQTCATDSTSCPIIDGTSCGLYFAKQLRTSDNLGKNWTCNRLVSPNGKFKLVLLYSGQLAIYNSSNKVTWQTYAPNPRERRSLVLFDDGTWGLWDVDLDYQVDYSPYYGTSYAANMGADNAPFTLRMGNDGNATIVNLYGNIAWTSYVAPPPPPPPPPTPLSTTTPPMAGGRRRRLIRGSFRVRK